jgi:hypothetical protein
VPSRESPPLDSSSPQETAGSPPPATMPEPRRRSPVQLVSPPPPSSPPPPDPEPSPPPAAESEPARRSWWPSGANAKSPSDGSKRATRSEIAELKGDLRETLHGLTTEAVELGSRGVHVALTARDPLARMHGVWKASTQQAEDIADPAVELMAAHIPPWLLEKTVVNVIRLGIAIGKYVTDHVALRNEVSPRTDQPRVVQTAPAQENTA